MRTKLPILILPLLLGACVYEDATDEQPSETPAAQPSQTQGYSVPIGAAEYDTAALEQGRLDPAWRQYAERDRLERLGTAPVPPAQGQSPLTTGTEPPPPTGAEGGAAATPSTPRRTASESYEQISPDALSGNPALPLGQEGGGPTVLRAQILLDRARFSPGVIDGNWGKNTAKAVYWFQFAKGLNATGEVDQGTWDALTRAAGAGEPLTRVQVTAEDLKGPWVDPLPDDPYQQAELDCLCYSSPLELFAERGHATPELIEQLNPQVDFANLQAGTEILLPNVPQVSAEDVSSQSGARATPAANRQGAQAAPAARGLAGGQVARLLISKRGFYLQALDAQGRILYHFPITLGSKYDPSATGTLQITGIHPEPGFHYQPKLFADVPDDKPEAQLPAGPNSPVGQVWIDLSKPHHGIHGTASPETIGYTSSHGCVRLTNWDALFLAQHVKPGTQVVFRE